MFQELGEGSMPDPSILVLNPGSTSTKLAWFDGDDETGREVLRHDAKALTQFASVWDQYDFRLRAVREWLARTGTIPAAVAGIGGLLKPVPSGTFVVNASMVADARANMQGAHASNLGCAMAFDVAKQFGCPAFTVDPVSVDEFEALARYSGHPLIERKSLSHALNLHAVARRAAAELGKPFERSSFVVAHLGGGISVAPVLGGRIIDANDASSDGPFSPERTGGLPLQQFISLCFSGKFTETELRTMVMGNGGLKAYSGTNSMSDIETLAKSGDQRARELLQAMGYQIVKEIGAMATVLSGRVDAIVLTGGMAGSDYLVQWISGKIGFLGRLLVYPGEDEMLALAQGVLRVLRHQEQPKEY